MSTLQVPPNQSRARAKSTSLTPALTLKSLGRRRSCNNLRSDPPDCTQPPKSMLASIVSRVLHSVHSPDWSQPPSPHKMSEDSLPLPASATKASFGDVVNEKPPSHHWFHGLTSVRSLFSVVLFIISCLFPDSRSHTVRHLPLSPLYRRRVPCRPNITNNRRLAQNSHRPCRSRSRASRILSKRSRARSPCNQCHGCHRRMETRVVNTGERYLERLGRRSLLSLHRHHSPHFPHHRWLLICHSSRRSPISPYHAFPPKSS